MYNPYYGNPVGGKAPPTMPAALKKMPQPPPISLHEFQLNEIRNQALDRRNTGEPGSSTSLPMPVTAVQWRGVVDNTLYLDSAYKNSTNGVIFDSLTFQVKDLNNGNDLSNITHIKVEPFYFPRLNPIANRPDPFYEKRVMLLINEIPSTAAVGTGAKNQFHFEFAVADINSVAVQLVPTFDTIYFQVPIQTMSSVTLNFLRPPYYDKIQLPPDIITVIMMPPSPPAVFTPTTNVKFAFTNNEQWYAISGTDVAANAVQTVLPIPPATFPTTALATQVAAWIPAPGTNSSVVNAILSDPLGNFIATVGDPIAVPLPLPSYSAPYGYFEIAGFTENIINTAPPLIFPPIDPAKFPGFLNNSVGIPMTVQIRKNRIAFQMRFSSLQGASTNGLIATHL